VLVEPTGSDMRSTDVDCVDYCYAWTDLAWTGSEFVFVWAQERFDSGTPVYYLRIAPCW
jgi:hypothetical protein